MKKPHDGHSLVRFVAREVSAYALHGALGTLRRGATVEAGALDEVTVLFVHGHGGGGGAFAPLERSLRARGLRRFAAWDYRARGTVDDVAERLARFARDLGGPLHVVGHSLGGIVSRAWLQEHGGHEQARSLVTLSTPHRGLRRIPGARALPLVREITAGSALLARLERGAHALERLRCLAVVSSRDHFVRPWHDAGFAAARLVPIATAGHVGLLYSREVHAIIADHLREEPTRR